MSIELKIQGLDFVITDTKSRVEYLREPKDILKFKVDKNDVYRFYQRSQVVYQDTVALGDERRSFDIKEIINAETGEGFRDTDELSYFLSTELGESQSYRITTNATLLGDGTPSNPLGVVSDPSSLKWLNKYEGATQQPISIDTTWVDLTPFFGVLSLLKQPSILDTFVLYDDVNEVFYCNPATVGYYSFNLSLALSGSLTASGNNSAEFEFAITRPVESTDPDFIVIRNKVYSQSNASPSSFIERKVYVENTFVFEGGSDPYQVPTPPYVAGFKIQVRKLSGINLELLGNQDIRFYS